MGLYPGRYFKVRFYGTRLFYKNNFKRTRLKFAQELLKNKLRTTEVPLQVEFVLKNTTSFWRFIVGLSAKKPECRSVSTAITNLCCINKINSITMFSNKTRQTAVNLDYTIMITTSLYCKHCPLK